MYTAGLLERAFVILGALGAVVCDDPVFHDDPGQLGIRGCLDPDLNEPAVPLYYGGAHESDYQLTEAFDFDGMAFPNTYVDYVANTFFRLGTQNGDGTAVVLGTSGVGTFSYRDASGNLQYVPEVTRADVNNIGGVERVETILTANFGSMANVTSTRRFPDPDPVEPTTRLELSVTIDALLPIALDPSESANDRFRAFTFSSMYSSDTEYDANLIRVHRPGGGVRIIEVGDAMRPAHLLPNAMEIGSWVEFIKTPGSTFNVGGPSVRVDILEVDGYSGRLGFQGFLNESLLTSDDSLTGWFEFLDAPDTIPAGAVYTVDLQVTAFQFADLIGDMDWDDDVDFDDINPFVLGLTDPIAYENQFGVSPEVKGDIDGDGDQDLGDIGPFKELLAQNGVSLTTRPAPEPSPVLLVALSLLGLAANGWRRTSRETSHVPA